MERLLRRRFAIYNKCVRLCETLKIHEFSKLSDSILKDQIQVLSAYEAEYYKFSNEIVDSDQCTKEIFDENNDDCAKFELLVQHIKELLHIEIDKRAEEQITGRIKIPDLQIPEFDGGCNNWRQFRDTFKAAIHENKQITDVAKFSCLLEKLKGEAKSLVDHIPITVAGYAHAWRLIVNRYNNERSIIESLVDALLCIPKLSGINSPVNIAHITNIYDIATESISALETWGYTLDKLSEAIIVRIIMARMDSNSRREFENVLSLDECPSWLKIEHFLKIKIRVLQTIAYQKKINAGDPNGNDKPVYV